MKLYSPPKTNDPNLDAWLERLVKELEEITVDSVVKGWIQFNGTGTIAIQDSFNVASISDEGTGDYDIIWDTDFANDDYACVGGVSSTHLIQLTTPLTTGITIETYTKGVSAGWTSADDAIIYILALGDQ